MNFDDVYQDYPFDDNWTAIRHIGNTKTFAFIYEYKGQMRLNLKTYPELISIWLQTYPCVQPAYHMNKRHWISVILDGSQDDDVIGGFITDSYKLTKPKLKKVK